MKGRLHELVSPFREFGLGAGTLYALDRLLQRLSPRLRLHVYELMAQPVAEKPLLPPNLAKNLEFRPIERDDPTLALMPARADIKLARFEQGAICLGAYQRGQLIGYVWFCFGAYDEDEVRCTYRLAEADRSVFDFDLVVLPEHRMGIGFTAVWHGANQYLRGRGVQYTFSRLTRFNLASRRSHAHLGWQAVGRAMFLRLGNAQLMLATLPPFVSLLLGARQRATLELRPPVRPASQPSSALASTGLGRERREQRNRHSG